MTEAERPVALVDILDRVLGRGTVVHGEIVLGVADIDLVRISLHALLASVRAEVAPIGPGR
ncbi:gas vesicle protein [Actinoplanes sp. NPDC051859]|uniref:gas vesicle protein n=1 Tax=Actinoplanes sp. NPDC051859 TaxID=3363909 RepID=UPI003796C363